MFLDFSDNLYIIIKNHVWYLFVHSFIQGYPIQRARENI